MNAPVQLDLLDRLPPLRSKRMTAFVEAIEAGKSRREAVEIAGYKARGHSADSTAWELLKRPEVRAHLQVRRALAVETAAVTSSQVIREIARVAFAEKPEDVGEWKGRLNDKLNALGMLARALGLWSEGGSLTVNATAIAGAAGFADRLETVMQRAKTLDASAGPVLELAPAPAELPMDF